MPTNESAIASGSYLARLKQALMKLQGDGPTHDESFPLLKRIYAAAEDAAKGIPEEIDDPQSWMKVISLSLINNYSTLKHQFKL